MLEIPNILLEIPNILFKIRTFWLKIRTFCLNIRTLCSKYEHFVQTNILFKYYAVRNFEGCSNMWDISNILFIRPINLFVISKCFLSRANKLLLLGVSHIFPITYCPLMCVCRLLVQKPEVKLLKTKKIWIFNNIQ